MDEHKTQGHICITCMIQAVKERLSSDTDFEQAAQLFAKTLYELDPNRVKWAIEDESERKKWENFVIQLAVTKYFYTEAEWFQGNDTELPSEPQTEAKASTKQP